MAAIPSSATLSTEFTRLLAGIFNEINSRITAVLTQNKAAEVGSFLQNLVSLSDVESNF
jgi:hypothetical protein